MLNLDTHVLLHALAGDLLAAERRLLTGNSWSISAIVLWEIAKLAQLGRIEVDLDDAELKQVIARVHVWPLDAAVCRESTHLDFTSDPADELIAATSIVHRVPLLTRDKRIRQSQLVPFAPAAP
jgi:PIN domain nuclease of toxin-antitoxin system